MAVMPPREEYKLSLKDQRRRSQATTCRGIHNPSSKTSAGAGRMMNKTLSAYRQRPQLRWIKTSAGLQMRWTPAES